MMTDGFKTTEFWTAAVGPAIVMVLNGAFGWNLDWHNLFGMFASTGAYAISRGMAKQGRK